MTGTLNMRPDNVYSHVKKVINGSGSRIKAFLQNFRTIINIKKLVISGD